MGFDVEVCLWGQILRREIEWGHDLGAAGQVCRGPGLNRRGRGDRRHEGGDTQAAAAFSLVARHMSFAKVATTLHLTPSAVSLQIKDLEMALGVQVFARRGQAVTLTPAGELLLGDVQRALSALQDAEDKLTRLRGQARDRVSIGMVSSAEYFLPRQSRSPWSFRWRVAVGRFRRSV